MQLYYTVFDRTYNMVGFARAQHTADEKLYHYNAEGEYCDTLLID